MSLNYGKSGYMIKNMKNDVRCDLKIDSGLLNYVECDRYLGVYISHSGLFKNNVEYFMKKKCKIL